MPTEATRRRRPHLGSDRLRIALLNAAEKAAETRRNFRRELDAVVEEFHCPSGELPDGFDYDAFVVTGSWASVYWDRKWIGRLKTWVGDAIEAGLPGLGVCFGHQLVADVMGGGVTDMDAYEIGYRRVEHDGGNRLLDGVSEKFTVFTSHSDRVTEAPPGATVFARNDYGIQGFRDGHVFAVQFHAEYDRRMARLVTEGKKGQLDDAHIQRLLDDITVENYRAATEAKRLFDNFVSYAAEMRAGRPT